MATEEKRMKQLGADAATWAANDIVPLQREICITVDGVNSTVKVGDGVSLHSALQVVSRRLSAEFNADIQTYLNGISTDVSAGPADAGKQVLLNSSGRVDDTMLPTGLQVGELNILGTVDFTALVPSPAGGHKAGDAYFNSTKGQFDGSWGFGQDASLNERPCEIGDMVIYDENISGFQFLQGRSIFEIIDRTNSADAPIGGLYNSGGTVMVRTS